MTQRDVVRQISLVPERLLRVRELGARLLELALLEQAARDVDGDVGVIRRAPVESRATRGGVVLLEGDGRLELRDALGEGRVLDLFRRAERLGVGARLEERLRVMEPVGVVSRMRAAQALVVARRGVEVAEVVVAVPEEGERGAAGGRVRELRLEVPGALLVLAVSDEAVHRLGGGSLGEARMGRVSVARHRHRLDAPRKETRSDPMDALDGTRDHLRASPARLRAVPRDGRCAPRAGRRGRQRFDFFHPSQRPRAPIREICRKTAVDTAISRFQLLCRNTDLMTSRSQRRAIVETRQRAVHSSRLFAPREGVCNRCVAILHSAPRFAVRGALVQLLSFASRVARRRRDAARRRMRRERSVTSSPAARSTGSRPPPSRRPPRTPDRPRNVSPSSTTSSSPTWAWRRPPSAPPLVAP